MIFNSQVIITGFHLMNNIGDLAIKSLCIKSKATRDAQQVATRHDVLVNTMLSFIFM